VTKKQLVILILACAFVGYLLLAALFLGPGLFGQDLSGSLNLLVLVSKFWWLILFGTLAVAIIMSIVFKSQGRPIKKIWMIAGLIIGITLLVAMFLTLLSASTLYQGMSVR